MAERDKDKLADALRALAGGKHVEPEGAPSDRDGLVDLTPGVNPPAKPAAKPGRPPVPGSMPPPPAPLAAPGAAPAKPPARTPLFRAGGPPPPVKPVKPAAPSRPAAPRANAPRPVALGGPTSPPTAPTPAPAPARPSKPRALRAERPTAPAAPAAPAAPPPSGGFVSDAGDDPFGAVADEDVQLDLPPVTPDMLAHLPTRPRPTVSVVSSVSHSVAFKRTIIPILLTLGVLLPLTASLKWVAGPGSPLALLPQAVVIGCCAVGAALLGVAVLNMLQVRDELARAKSPTQRT